MNVLKSSKIKKSLKQMITVLTIFVMTIWLAACNNVPSNQAASSSNAQDGLAITSTKVSDGNVYITGTTKINPEKSTYIQYYVGKKYQNTLTTCILCNGFNADKEGHFQLTLPVKSLKGPGSYQIVLEQNPVSNAILPANHWQAFKKDEKGVQFGDITSMGEISNLALTVGMKIAETEVNIDGNALTNDAIKISNINTTNDGIVVEGTTNIDPQKSKYIQYYVGKNYPETISECIYCNGFNVDNTGKFKAEIPKNLLKGDGNYQIVLEQNPNSNTILPPKHWQAIQKDAKGVQFGDITSMGEISNLALAVGMQTSSKEFTIGTPKETKSVLSIASTKVENGNVVIKGTTKISKEKSTYIQYYIGKEYENTLSNCMVCDGIKADNNGNFELTIPVEKLRGNGKYKIVFEQNPNSNSIIEPNHWKAIYKDGQDVKFGDISAMGEISNLALIVGMDIVEGEISIDSQK